MVANPWEFEEVRLRYVASFPTGYTAGNAAAWYVGTATKINHRAMVDLASLEQSRAPSAAVQTRRRAAPDGILGPKSGSFDLVLPFNSDGGTGQNAAKVFLEKVWLGISTPGAYTDALDASGTHTKSKLFASGLNGTLAPGSALLCGVRGDTKGNGEVRPVLAEGTDYAELTMETLGTMVDTDAIWLSHTVFPDEAATPGYIEALVIGTDGRQANCIGCQVTGISFEGLNIAGNEEAVIKFTLTPAVWRWEGEPTGTKATIDKTTAPSGPSPAEHKGTGGFFIGPHGQAAKQSRTFAHGGKWSVNPDFKYMPLRSPTGQLTETSVVDWVMGGGRSTWSMTAIRGVGTPNPDAQYYQDFISGNKLQVLFQVGCVAGACVAIELQGTYLDRLPVPDEIDGFGGAKLEGHGDENNTTGSETALQKADIRVHFFHAS